MKIDSVDPKSGLGSSTSRSLDDELLKEAMNHIPKDADEKAKKATKVFKRPSMMKRPSAAGEEGSSAVPAVVQAGGLAEESSMYIAILLFKFPISITNYDDLLDKKKENDIYKQREC